MTNPVITELNAIRAEQELLPCPWCTGPSHLEANSAVPGGLILVHDGKPECPLIQTHFRLERWNTRHA